MDDTCLILQALLLRFHLHIPSLPPLHLLAALVPNELAPSTAQVSPMELIRGTSHDWRLHTCCH